MIINSQKEEFSIADAQKELNAHEKWCKKNKLFWDEELALACIALIKSGRYKTVKNAHEKIIHSIYSIKDELKQAKNHILSLESELIRLRKMIPGEVLLASTYKDIQGNKLCNKENKTVKHKVIMWLVKQMISL